MPIKVVHKDDTAYDAAYDTQSVRTALTSTLQQTNKQLAYMYTSQAANSSQQF